MSARAEVVVGVGAEALWDLTRKTATQMYLSRSTFTYDAELPDVREEGYEGEHRVRLFGLIPAWRHWQRFERVDDERRELFVRERGGPYRTWNHGMRVESCGERGARFVDWIDVEGRPALITPLVWLAARSLCRSRMRRLEELARVLA